MKTLQSYNLIIIGFASIIACSDDPVYNPFIGTWRYVQESYTECDNPSDNGTFDLACNASDCYRLMFQGNGKLTYESLVGGMKSSIEGTYSFDGNKITLCSTGCDEAVTFSITANSLSLVREDNAGCTVTTFLEKEL